MLEIEMLWPDDVAEANVITHVEACCCAIGLTQTLRGTLGKYPGCTHWHYKNGKATGVLEITVWPNQHRLWFVGTRKPKGRLDSRRSHRTKDGNRSACADLRPIHQVACFHIHHHFAGRRF